MRLKKKVREAKQHQRRLKTIEAKLISESPKPMIGRDIQIFKDFCTNKHTYQSLATKYDLSTSRVQQVINYLIDYLVSYKKVR